MKLGRRTVVRASIPVVLVVTSMVCSVGTCVGFPCFSTGIQYGMWLDECPDTDLRLSATAGANGLVRGKKTGLVTLAPTASWLRGESVNAWAESAVMKRGVDVEWSLKRGDEVVDGLVMEDATWDGYQWVYETTLPAGPDGDYTLLADVVSGFEAVQVEVPLALYTPAMIHVAADRPLYKPGQEVKLRAAVLRRTDQTPLEDRPGRWQIRAPDGTEMHVEKSKGGPWGVSATTFPLSDAAEHGTWTATYLTGADTATYSFKVLPFQLPRLRVEAKGAQRWFHIGEDVVVEGTAVYASGAPVRNAAITARIRLAEGRWPIPLAWEEPFEAKTLPDGTFSISLGSVPSDLMERAVLSAAIQAVDETGEVVNGSAKLVLAVDDIQVDAVTELGDGFVENANNRAYVRVRTPDGKPLANHDIVVSSPFDPTGPTYDATTDADGVAAIQLDPGKPITVVTPAPPARPRPLTPAEPQLSNATEMGMRRSLDMSERRATDRVQAGIAACGVYAVGSKNVQVAVRVAPSGGVSEVVGGNGKVEECVSRVARGLRFPVDGAHRMYQLVWQVPDSLQPSLTWDTNVAIGTNPISSEFTQAGLEARRCFPRGSGVTGTMAARVHWSVPKDSTALRIDLTLGSETGLPASARSCIQNALSRVRLAAPAATDAAGVTTARLSVPRAPGSAVPQATTRPGYELEVVASVDAEVAGTSRLQMGVGQIPPIRLRATPSLAKPGERVSVKMFRGPNYSGELPKKLQLRQGDSLIAEVERTENEVVFTLPKDAAGFYDVSFNGGRAVVFVAAADPLSVTLSTDKPVYRPGDEATLTVKTLAGETGSPAAVMIAGVDDSLSQLTPLMATDDFGNVTVRATSDRPAFDVFDARMLALGQVRGENAAMAAVLRVGQLPSDSSGDAYASGSGFIQAPVEEALSVAFYATMDALVTEVRGWEKAAPKGEVMVPKIMAALWEKARKTTGTASQDGYGRALTLDVLPDDLLVQVDPRVMVVDGTRLPEDQTPWVPYVRREVTP